VVVQADWFEAPPTVVVLPLTSTLLDAAVTRIDVAPRDGNGLQVPSQIAVDRPQTVRREKLGPVIGHLDQDAMLAVNRAIAVLLGLA
jgi:mRNA interferase MazF